MIWLSALSPWRWYAVAAAVSLVAASWFWQRHQIDGLKNRLEAEKTGRLADRANAAEDAASAALAYRAKEQAWAKSREDIINVAIEKTEAAASAVVAAHDASDRLRARVAAITAAGRAAACNPAAAGASAPAADPIGMLADVLGRADARAGKLAEYADRARIAGDACVSAYESLK